MPDQKGRFTPQERAFAEAYAATEDRAYSAAKAGLVQPATAASKMLARETVQAEIARIQVERLFNEALPAAVDCLVSIIRSDKAPAGARVQAAKVVMDRTLGATDAANGKAPHEMSGEELARAIAELERVASDRAKPVNAAPVEPVQPDIMS